jgi:hypothetical protein
MSHPAVDIASVTSKMTTVAALPTIVVTYSRSPMTASPSS